MFKVIKRMLDKKKREVEREIEKLKKDRLEKIEDAAYWYRQGDHKEYMNSIMQAVEINDQILMRRREAAG